MLGVLFSFSGRLDRPTFIRWSTLQATLSILLLEGLRGLSREAIGALSTGASIGTELPRIGIVIFMGVLLVILPSSALLVKRLRDVGLPAWPCFLLIATIDIALTGLTPDGVATTNGPFGALTFTIAVTVLLALLPGREQAIIGIPESQKPAEKETGALPLVERRLQLVPPAQARLFMEMEALESIRRGERPSEPMAQSFGRRKGDRRM